MYSYYKDDYEKSKEYLLKMLKECFSRDADTWFEKCKQELSPEDYSKFSDYLHQTLKEQDLDKYLHVKAEEGELQEVYDYLKENRKTLYTGVEHHDLERKIADAYPKEALDWFWEVCKRNTPYILKVHHREFFHGIPAVFSTGGGRFAGCADAVKELLRRGVDFSAGATLLFYAFLS